MCNKIGWPCTLTPRRQVLPAIWLSRARIVWRKDLETMLFKYLWCIDIQPGIIMISGQVCKTLYAELLKIIYKMSCIICVCLKVPLGLFNVLVFLNSNKNLIKSGPERLVVQNWRYTHEKKTNIFANQTRWQQNAQVCNVIFSQYKL